MSAVWRAARAAVRRRRLQTIVIGVVVGLATTMIVVALGLLTTASGPFEQAYAKQRGAHLVAAFDAKRVSSAQLAEAARRSETAAVAGPFGQAAVDLDLGTAARPPLSLTVVGRADPGGPVDRLNVWQGRWPTKPGEIVLNRNPVAPTQMALGGKVGVPGGGSLTIVGFAYTVSESADAWVTPDQMTALKPTTFQVLYRFTDAATDKQIDAGQAAVTAGLPAGALLGAQSYLPLKTAAAAEPGTFIPLLLVFGVLGLAVAVLIVANVVSGAVVAGFRHIGVLKALGFTPTQVLAVYLAMVSIPAIVGCVLGTILGNLMARPLLANAFENFGAGDLGITPWVDVGALAGVPAVVALSALVPAWRARGLSASEAISAGSSQHTGRGLLVQRWLSGTRLPRSVSLGLGMPFARPARSALTMAAVILGVLSVALSAGLGQSVIRYQNAENRTEAVQVTVFAGRGPASSGAQLSDAADEKLLRSLPGAVHVTAGASLMARPVGSTRPLRIRFYRGDTASLGFQVLKGHWPDGPNQVAVSERFLRQRGLAVGDTLTVEMNGHTTRLKIAGKVLLNDDDAILSTWETLALVAPETRAEAYEVQLEPGTDEEAYLAGVRAGDPGLQAFPSGERGSFIAVVLVTVTLLTLMLGSVAALGVFNTVVLNTRERRRDLGMLKSIGMTPGQVTVMVVTSMAALGAVGALVGVPLGIAAHRVVFPAMARAAQVAYPESILDVYEAPVLVLLALAGVGIAALGAFIPARSAARTTIAEVLHNE